jgi:hypothetical protein
LANIVTPVILKAAEEGVQDMVRVRCYRRPVAKVITSPVRRHLGSSVARLSPGGRLMKLRRGSWGLEAPQLPWPRITEIDRTENEQMFTKCQ